VNIPDEVGDVDSFLRAIEVYIKATNGNGSKMESILECIRNKKFDIKKQI